MLHPQTSVGSVSCKELLYDGVSLIVVHVQEPI
jgi:hypothetical protein